jgi:hypothetical protein
MPASAKNFALSSLLAIQLAGQDADQDRLSNLRPLWSYPWYSQHSRTPPIKITMVWGIKTRRDIKKFVRYKDKLLGERQPLAKPNKIPSLSIL